MTESVCNTPSCGRRQRRGHGRNHRARRRRGCHGPSTTIPIGGTRTCPWCNPRGPTSGAAAAYGRPILRMPGPVGSVPRHANPSPGCPHRRDRRSLIPETSPARRSERCTNARTILPPSRRRYRSREAPCHAFEDRTAARREMRSKPGRAPKAAFFGAASQRGQGMYEQKDPKRLWAG